jgi:hypothetical protein
MLRPARPILAATVLATSPLLVGCGADVAEQTDAASASGLHVADHLYVWATDAAGESNDFLAIYDANPESDGYGSLVSTIDVGEVAAAHHSEHFMPEGDRLFVNGFRTGKSFVINVGDPTAPFVESAFEIAGPYSHPHSFERTESGTVLSTFQNRGTPESPAGGLVELDSVGNYLRGADAADPTDPELRPYSVTRVPGTDRIVTTTTDMWGELEGRSIQIWRESDFELLHTLVLPPGPAGTEGVDVAEARVLSDGRSVIVNTFRCGMYLLTGVDTDEPQIEFIYSVPWESYEAGDQCSVPWLSGDYWVQTVNQTNSVVVLDVSNPREPRQVSEVVLGEGVRPHWLSGEIGGDRLVLTGGGDWLGGRAVLLHLDPNDGTLTVIDDFRTPGSDYPGVDMNDRTWPHGATGSAIPHGAVFSR